MTEEPKYKQLSFRDHTRKLGEVNLGTFEISEISDFYFNPEKNIFEKETIEISPALTKLCDEIIVNACDQKQRFPNEVNTIKITFDGEEISVYNNGEGIKIEYYEDKGVYSVQMIMSMERSGENFDESKKKTCGGRFGLGCKLVNCCSTSFYVETVDSISQQKYSQLFEDGTAEIHPPKIKPSAKKPYTLVKFKPEFSLFKYTKMTNKLKASLEKYIVTRAYHTAVFTGANVYYNETKIPVKNINQFVKLLNYEKICDFQIPNINVVICNSPINTDKIQNQIMILNGININGSSTLNEWFCDNIINKNREKIDKLLEKYGAKFSKAMIYTNIFPVYVGTLENPTFDSQTKTRLTNPRSTYKDWEISEDAMKKMWKYLDLALNNYYLLSKKNGSGKEKKNNKKREFIEEKTFKDANWAGKKSGECMLMVTEGLSAKAMMQTGITKTSNPNISYNNVGILALRGVIMNVRKQIDTQTAKRNAKRIAKSATNSATHTPISVEGTTNTLEIDGTTEHIMLRKKKLQDNEIINKLEEALGLNPMCKYETEEEFRTLRYSSLGVATDADLDGSFIFILIANIFDLFYPNLIKHGFLKRLLTPIIRLIPKNDKDYIEEFYTEKDYEEWAVDHQDILNKYQNPKYFKGLGGNSNEEAVYICDMFDRNIRTCRYTKSNTEINEKLFDKYLGDDPDARKVIYSDPNVEKLHLYPDNTLTLKNELCSEVKEFGLDRLRRSLLHSIDGFNSSRRKIFAGAKQHFKESNKEIKVFQLGGDIAYKLKYHHGDASLSNTMMIMCGWEGSIQVPVFEPHGQFGTRYDGGAETMAKPRYADIRANKNVMYKLFPEEDDYFLNYTLDDGGRVEPDFYVPIIPYTLTQTYKSPAVGWKIEQYARDVFTLFDIVRKMIKGDMVNDKYISPWNPTKGHIIIKKNKEYSIGCYEKLDDNKFTITELPLEIWVVKYLESLEKISVKNGGFIKSAIDVKSNDDDINILVKIEKGSAPQIEEKYGSEETDAFEEYLKLINPMGKCLNMIKYDGSVVEYNDYFDLIEDWFPIRKKIYEMRIERELIILELKIQLMENIIRFVVDRDKYKLSKLSEEAGDKILSENNFIRYNDTILNNPGYYKNEELKDIILHKNATYNYIYKLPQRDVFSGEIEKKVEKIKEYQDRLNYLKNNVSTYFLGSDIWLQELNELEEVIKEGLARKWKIKSKGKHKK